jgi:transitional endoplasmic reticulum ATPase
MATKRARIGAVNATIENTDSTRIILPTINGKQMTKREAIEALTRQLKEDEQIIQPHAEMDCSPLDGAVALMKAIAELYGWSGVEATPGFWGPTPPTMVTVVTGPNEKDRVQIPWGSITIPGIEGRLQTGMRTKPMPKFYISGEIKKKNEKEITDLFDKTRQILRERSIYKGKSVLVSFEWHRDGGDDGYDPLEHCPKYFRIDGVKEDDLILNADTEAAINNGLFYPIEASEALRKVGTPIKRGVLLAGKYGTGKTLTAAVTAIKANRAGFTFIYLKSVKDLEMGYRMAIQYAPTVVFVEDIDQAFQGDRSVEMNEILNILDGVDSKGKEIVTVFTTNHVERINPAVLRPGRIDKFVRVLPPDQPAVIKLVQKYARGLLAEGTDLQAVAVALEGHIPAFIRETIEAAKITAIGRQVRDGVNPAKVDVTGMVMAEDILAAAAAMREHAELLEPKAREFETKPRLIVDVDYARLSDDTRRQLGMAVKSGILSGGSANGQ